MFKPNIIIKIEELCLFLLTIYLFSILSYPWWIYPLTILLPDIGMAGYLINNKTGAWIYNLFHHKAIAILLYIAGYYLDVHLLQLFGIIVFGHASMDRLFGFGLKYQEGFKFTHLGKLN